MLVGEHDKPFLRASEVMAAKLPNATRQVIPDAGHILNIEAAAAFDAALVDFLKQQPAAG